MNAYFASQENYVRLLQVLESWAGTPFFPRIGVKMQGTDCIRFVEAVYAECGVFAKHEDWPGYVITGAGKSMLDYLLAQLSSQRELALLPPKTSRMRGDLIVFSRGHAGHHVGIATEHPHLWDCTKSRGVGKASILDPAYARNIWAVYRPTA